MKIVLTGGTGFLGRHLISALQQKSHTLIVLTRNPRPSQPSTGVQYVQWDAKTMSTWAEQIDGADAVINLAGESIGSRRWTSAQKERIRSSRIDATRAVVQAIERATRKPEVLVNASAVGYYGNVPEGDVTEDVPAGKNFLGETCLAWENEARKVERLGVRLVLPRTGIVLDKHGGALPRMILPFRLFVGGPLGSGEQWFPWIHLEDEIGAMIFALEKKNLTGPVNCAAPEPIRMREFCRALGRAMKRPSWAPVPSFVLKIVLGEMSTLVLDGQRVLPKKLLEAGYEFTFPKLEEALKQIVGRR